MVNDKEKDISKKTLDLLLTNVIIHVMIYFVAERQNLNNRK